MRPVGLPWSYTMQAKGGFEMNNFRLSLRGFQYSGIALHSVLKIKLYAIKIILFIVLVSTESFGSDWKCLTLMTNPVDGSFIASCYDEDSIVWNGNIIRYWSKSVSFEVLAELPTNDPKTSKYIAETAIKLINSGYVPNVMKTKSIKLSIPVAIFDKFIYYTTMIEQLANLERTKAIDKSCFEINVNEQLFRLVSVIEFSSQGMPNPRTINGEWKSIHPDSQISSALELFKMIKK